jgi:hypothetical protein
MTCFGAGIAVGLVVPDVVEALSVDESQDADEEFIERFTEEYDLTSEQVGLLSMILASREEEEMRQFSSFGHLNLPPELQRRLEGVNKRADDRIQQILNEEQRKLYQEERDKKGKQWPRP